MIRPPTEQLRGDIPATVGIVALLALAMAIPGAGLFASASVDRLAERWMADFEPVVYMSATSDKQTTEKLAATIGDWAGVSDVTVRAPKDAFQLARERLGEKDVSKVGLEPGMFPYSLVIGSERRLIGNVDLVARLSALETRENVDSVDLPTGGAATVAESAGWLATGALVLFGVFCLAALFQLAAFLSRMRSRDRHELALLERFGATPGKLRKPTLVRGVVVGLWAGLVAFALLMVLAVYWRSVEQGLLGGMTSASVGSWAIVAAPVLLGPLTGGFVGWVTAMRPERSGNKLESESTVRLLDYG